MEERQVINDSYYCGRILRDGKISILTGNSYVVGEYDERTGDIRWQRVVNASQKEHIINWLSRHYPVKVEPVAVVKKPGRKKALAAV